jgi:GT2 family glycosyltransferase
MREHVMVGIAGPKLILPSGVLNEDAMPRRFPRLWEMMSIVSKVPHVFPRMLDDYLYRDRDFTREQRVDSVRGSCMLVRRTFVDELGWAFDPRYFIWFEDVDTCREAYRHHFQVVYTPIISCIDLVGQTFAQRTVWWKQKQFIKSMMVYFLKWGVL